MNINALIDSNNEIVFSEKIDNHMIKFDGQNFELNLTQEEVSDLYMALREIHCGLSSIS